jgi:hypothetical protein
LVAFTVEGFLLSRAIAWAQTNEFDHDLAYLAAIHQRSLSADAIGDFKMRANDSSGALAAYHEGLAIARQLLAAEPDNVQWLADIVVSLWKVSQASKRADKISKLEEALGFLKKLEGQGSLTARQRGWRPMIEAEMAKLAAEEPSAATTTERPARTHVRQKY